MRHQREHIDTRWNPYKTCLSFRIQKVIAIISITPRILRSLLITNRRKSIKENCRSNYSIDISTFVRNKIIGGDEIANCGRLWNLRSKLSFRVQFATKFAIRNSKYNTIKRDRSHDAALADERLCARIRFPVRDIADIAETALREIARGNDWSQRKTPGFRHRFVCRGASVSAGPGNKRFTRGH